MLYKNYSPTAKPRTIIRLKRTTIYYKALANQTSANDNQSEA